MSEWWEREDQDVLVPWVAEYAGEIDEEAIRGTADWLRNKATTDDWYRAVSDLNWGFGVEPFVWIIRQARCDKATALRAFYMARPGEMLDYENDFSRVPGFQQNTFHLVSEIRTRFMSGFYTRSTIAFDADHFLKKESYAPENPPAEALDAVIPPLMRQSLPGRTLAWNRFDVEPVHCI